MNLRRSDKIIAVAGIVILIIAVIAIVAYYVSIEETPEEEVLPELETFYVTWTKETGETSIDGTAEKVYNKPFPVMAPPGSVLTSVDFRLTWQDDYTTGILPILPRFQDTLKAEVSLEGGEPQPHTSTGGCKNESLLFSVNDIPMIDSVEAEDIYEAEEIINEMIFGQDSASFDVKVTVTIGEKIRRPLMYLRDKGNSFKFDVVYEYCYPELEGGYEEDYDGGEGDGGGEGSSYQSMVGLIYLKNLCYGRNWI